MYALCSITQTGATSQNRAMTIILRRFFVFSVLFSKAAIVSVDLSDRGVWPVICHLPLKSLVFTNSVSFLIVSSAEIRRFHYFAMLPVNVKNKNCHKCQGNREAETDCVMRERT